MCASCVAQGAVYVGGALATLQVMGARARARRRADRPGPERADDTPASAGAGARDGLRAGQPG